MDGNGRPDRPILKGLLAAFAAAWVVCLVVPAQSYVANAAEFAFGWPQLLLACLPYFVGVTAVCSVINVMAARRGWVWPSVLCLAVALAVLMEVGPLSIGLPEVDGRMSTFKNHFRQCWNLAAWGVLIVVPMLFRQALYQKLNIIVPLFVLYASATVADSRGGSNLDGELPSGNGYLVNRMYRQADVMGSVRYAARRNVFLLVVDSLSADIASEALRQNPEVADKFSGFVAYERNVGMDWPTRAAIPAIFTGRLRQTTEEQAAFGHAYLKVGSFLEPYLRADWPVFVNLDVGFGGYTNRRVESRPQASHVMRMSGAFAWSVGEISVFRSLPYIFKRHYLRHVTHRWETLGLDGWYAADKVLWPMLSGCTVESLWQRSLQIHHTRGIHKPITFDRKGNQLLSNKVTRQSYVDASAYVLERIGEFFDALRQKGLYDSSTLLLIADHGVAVTNEKTDGLDGKAFPVLMTKPARASGPLVYSSAKTSHAGLAPVLRALEQGDLSRQEIEGQLVRAPRQIRHFENGKVFEWRP